MIAGNSGFVVNLTDGDWLWNVECNDSTGNYANATNNWTLTIDTSIPTITILHPVNGTTYNSSSLDLNWTVNEDIDWCGYSLDGYDNSSIPGWDLSTATYDAVNISTQDNSPTGLFFKPDGTKLYEVGRTTSKFYQYTCSDAWNLSSCTYDSISISTQNDEPQDLFFKPDGTKLYEIGRATPNKKIYQSTCTDAWNLSSCTYDAVNISTQNLEPTGLFFKPDGTKLYESDLTTDKIYQYSCTDAWNLSSCTYDAVNISTQDNFPTDLFFKPDGTKLYESDLTTDKIYQYSCSDAWNLSSCSYDSITISTQNGIPMGLFFKPDGTKLYEIGLSGDDIIYQYSLDNSTNITLPFLLDGSHNVTIYCNNTIGNMGQSNYTYFKINTLTLYLDSLSIDRKYEYGTTINISETTQTTTTICFDILDNTSKYLNVGCGVNSTYLFNINETVVILFNDSSLLKNLTNTSNSTIIIIDNRTDLVELKFNITGYSNGTYPRNITIDIGGDGTIDAMIHGRLVGDNYEIDDFIYNDVYYSAYNLTYTSKGNKIIYLNLTTAGNRSRNGTLNFSINSFDIDAGNDFLYDENFSKEQGSNFSINYSNSSGVNTPFIFDDMYSNDTYNKYTWGEFSEGTADLENSGVNQTNSPLGDPPGKLQVYVYSTTTYTRFSTSSPDFNLREINQISFELESNLGCLKPDSGSATVNNYLFIYGETNEQSVEFIHHTIPTCRRPDFTTDIWDRNYTLYWSSEDVLTLNYSGNLVSNSVAGLEGSLRLVLKSSAGMGGTGVVSSFFKMDNLNISGIGLNRTTGAYEGLNNWTSDNLFEAPSNIERAKFIATELTQDYTDILSTTDINYWLSNDNGSTWETAVNDTFNAFDSTGQSLKIKAELNTSNLIVSPIITNLEVIVAPTGGCNLSISTGGGTQGDGMIIGVGLSTANTPIYYNGTDQFIKEYNDNCFGQTCLVPVRFETNQSCMLQIADMNYTKNPYPLNFTNLTNFERDNLTINFSFKRGIIELSNLVLEYFGSKNISIFAFKQDDRSINDSRVVQVRYSHFNLSYPSGQDYWIIEPKSRNQSGIEPYGQNSSTGIWQVESNAYDDTFSIYARYNQSINSCVDNMTFNTTTPLCYQETANVSTACGGLNTGKYFTAHGESNWYDGNWSTHSNWVNPFYFNYTKVSFALNSSKLQVAFGPNGTPENKSIPTGCWNQQPLQFNAERKATPSGFWNLTCWDGSSWLNISEYYSAYTFWEEAMWWNNTNSTTLSINLNTTYQEIISKMDNTRRRFIWTYTDILCGGSNTDGIYIPYFCFKSRCEDCVKDTVGWNTNCNWLE